MKYFAEFLDIDLAGEMTKPCGSDSVFILDGRNNLDTMITDAHNRLKALNKHVHPTWCGFNIMKGDRFDSAVVVYRYSRSDV